MVLNPDELNRLTEASPDDSSPRPTDREARQVSGCNTSNGQHEAQNEDELVDGGLYYDDPDPIEEEEEEEEPEEEPAAETAAASSRAARPAPVAGPGQHVVQQGESLISLGYRYRVNPQSILNHPDNQHLVQQGREVAVLNPGDVVTLPGRSGRSVSCATEQRHRFVYHGAFTTLKMKFANMEGPLSGEPYRLQVEDRHYQGRLDNDGGMDERIPAHAQHATMYIGANGEQVVDIGVGHLNPISEISGVQMRLNNLGYPCGNEDGEAGPRTRAAILRFQADNDLDEGGEIDEQTRDRLQQAFGC
jgi:hypothetical protein